MQKQKFTLLAGSLALENKPFHLPIAEEIKTIFSNYDGYVGYKLTTLGRASESDVPSFLIFTQQHGIILLDVVEEKIDSTTEFNENEYWITDSKNQIAARSLIIEIYEEEVRSRLKNDLSFYDRKTRKIKIPINSAVIFCRNDEANIRSWYTQQTEYTSIPLTYGSFQDWLTKIPINYNCSANDLDRIYALLDGTFIYENKTTAITEIALLTVDDYIQKSLKTTFKQDEAQRLASMQLPQVRSESEV